MAVHCATNADYLKRTSGFLNPAANSTVCFWVKFNTVATSPAYQTGYVLLDAVGTYVDYIANRGNSASLRLNGNMAALTTTAPVANTWYHIAWSQFGTSQFFFVNAQQIGSRIYNRAAVAITLEQLCSDTLDNGDVTVAYVREWQTFMSSDQILDEMQSLTAMNTTGLFMDCPLTSDLLDISGNGHDWTQVGSGTFVAPPTFPSNHTADTAIPISTTLPNTVTQDFADGIVAWYSYTPTTDSPNMLGFWAFTDVADHLETAAYTGSPSSLTLAASGVELPMQLPLDVGTTWYLRLLMDTNTPPAEDVVMSSVPGPTGGWAAGDILVPFDGNVPRAAVLSSGSTSYSVKSFVEFPACEQADVLSDSGIMCAGGSISGQFELFNADFTSIINVAPTTVGTLSVRSHQPTQTFYVGMAGSGGTHASVRTLDATGAYGATTWTLAIAGLSFIAANNDETILYYTSSSAANAAIKRWDLTNDVALTDFVAGVSGYKVFDIYVLSDDTILITTYNASTFDAKVRQYDAAGTVLHTYTTTDHGADFRVASMIEDTVSFLRWSHATGISTIDDVKISDGSVLDTQNQAEYEGGVYSSIPKPTATPLARFGLSNTCPILVLRTAVNPVPPGDPVTTLIRRERIFRHLSDEQQWIFYQWLQIDAEAGVGLSTGQGSDPQIILQWSDDGGHTWSNEHILYAGKQGEYSRRAMLKQPLGRSRDRVFKVAMSDPVKWALLNAYFGAEKGSS